MTRNATATPARHTTLRKVSFPRLKPISVIAMAAAFAGVALGAKDARADDTINRPGEHPMYNVELEPHAAFTWDGLFAAGGFGLGGRASIPIVDNGFVKSINNSVAISFGFDVMNYDGHCAFRDRICSATYLFLPVAMQWNFYVARKWSVFGEPGLFVYKGFLDECPANEKDCVRPTSGGVRPLLYLGGRYHFNETVALTLRVGYPSASIGVSFFL